MIWRVRKHLKHEIQVVAFKVTNDAPLFTTRHSSTDFSGLCLMEWKHLLVDFLQKLGCFQQEHLVYEMKANTTEEESVVSAHYDGWCATLGPPCLLPLGCFFACLKSISLFADACYCSRRLPPSARVALFKTAKCVGVQTAFRRTPECINCCKRGPTGLS